MKPSRLSKREREVMDILHRLGQISAADIRGEMSAPPSYSAVRSVLRILEIKGHIRHEIQGTRYLYAPTSSAQEARSTALDHLVDTFFSGSTASAVLTLITERSDELDDEILDRLSAAIDCARKEGR